MKTQEKFRTLAERQFFLNIDKMKCHKNISISSDLFLEEFADEKEFSICGYILTRDSSLEKGTVAIKINPNLHQQFIQISTEGQPIQGQKAVISITDGDEVNVHDSFLIKGVLMRITAQISDSEWEAYPTMADEITPKANNEVVHLFKFPK